jgi:hypothetical protein
MCARVRNGVSGREWPHDPHVSLTLGKGEPPVSHLTAQEVVPNLGSRTRLRSPAWVLLGGSYWAFPCRTQGAVSWP